MAKVLRHRRYVKSYVGKNNNKFWYITEYDNGVVETHWGRVGEAGKTTTHDFGGDQEKATKKFDSMCRSKEKGKKDEPPYRLLDVVNSEGDVITESSSGKVGGTKLESLALTQIAGNNSDITKLVKRLIKENVHNITSQTNITYDEATGLFSTPCGIVSQANVDQARDLLTKMEKYVTKEDFHNSKYIDNMEEYLMLVPKDIGRKKLDPETVFPDIKALQQQNDILDSLQASLDQIASGSTTKKKSTPTETVFRVKLEPLTDKKEFKRIRDYYQRTRQRGHSCSHLDVLKAYILTIETMEEAFNRDGKKVGHIKELWHGTRVSNILSIMSKGLIIPPTGAGHVTGRMFGNGVYFSDQSTKALNYSYGYWGGGTKDDRCFAFLADVAMGKAYTPSSGWGSNLPRPGYDSTFAKAHTSGVRNNEMIVYRTSQCNLKFLIEFCPWQDAKH